MRATLLPCGSTTSAHVNVSQLQVSADDNPRFDQSGRSPTECAAAHYRSPEYRALCNSLDRLGIQVPLIVERIDKTNYRVLDGHGRANWAITTKQRTVPVVIIAPCTPRDRLAVQVATNVSRNTFAPLARAKAFSKLLQAYNGDVKAAAKVAGVSTSTLTETLNLLLFPLPVQQAVGTRRIPLNCLDILVALPGWNAYKAVKRGDDVSDGTVEEAEKYEDRLTQIITNFTEDDLQTHVSPDDILSAWNAAKVADRVVTKKGKKRKVQTKGKAKPPSLNEIVTLTPTEDSVRDVLERYGTALAREILFAAEPSKGKIKRHIDLISNIAACMGWCVPVELQDVLVTTTGKPLYDAKTAEVLTRDVVREYAALGAIAVGMERGLDLPENDPLREDAAWEAYIRQPDATLTSIVKGVHKRLVSFRRKHAGT